MATKTKKQMLEEAREKVGKVWKEAPYMADQKINLMKLAEAIDVLLMKAIEEEPDEAPKARATKKPTH